ncbi:hypothetical protein [Maribacter litopenaei]
MTQSDIDESRPMNRIFEPQLDRAKRRKLYAKWKKAVERSKGWEEE